MSSSTPTTSTTTGTSISTLTTDTTQPTQGTSIDNVVDVDFGIGGGFDNEEDPLKDRAKGEDGQGEDCPDPQKCLRSIFDCEYIQACVVNDGKDGWKCGWCKKNFSPKHASRALSHVLKIRKNGIEICKAVIPEINRAKYSDLYKANMERKMSKKRTSNSIEDSVEMLQTSSVEGLLRKRGDLGAVSVRESSFVSGLSTRTAGCLSFSGGASTSDMPSYTSVKGRAPLPFAFSSQRTMSTMNLDIRKSNNATVEMAIADFFHCENIPDAVVESQQFQHLIKVCRLVGEDFVVPHRKKIGGELLDLNYRNTYERNKAELLKEVKMFGLAFMGDGATIHRMPLMNILAMSGVTPPITISIQDCSKHMADGGKKDALYIADMFEEKVIEYDPEKIYTDVFFFDGASNVQKAGEVLMARFPRTFCFHRGEHVVSLFFSSIAKIKPIKVG